MGSGGESDPGASDAPSFLGIPAVALKKLSVRDIAPGDFERAHVDRAVPAVLTDVAASWPCASKWSLEWFAETHGDVRVAADDGTKEKMKCTLREFAEISRSCKSSDPGRSVPYLRTWNFLDDLPELSRDFDSGGGGYFRNCFDALRPEWRPPFTWAFLGGAGARTKLHVDVWHTDAWLTVLEGSKRFILFHPGQTKHVFDEKTHPFADLLNCGWQDIMLEHKRHHVATADVLHHGEFGWDPSEVQYFFQEYSKWTAPLCYFVTEHDACKTPFELT